MQPETDLSVLLSSMQAELHPQGYVFRTMPFDQAQKYFDVALGIFREKEGITLILADADIQPLPAEPHWAWISLNVFSALNAVGFMAAVSTALAGAGISVNPVAGYYHDHLFVPWAERERALSILRTMSTLEG